MAVNIKKQDFTKGILAKDMKDGHAYMSEYGTIYIGNASKAGEERIKAFSVCGTTIAYEDDSDLRFLEIDLDIIVK